MIQIKLPSLIVIYITCALNWLIIMQFLTLNTSVAEPVRFWSAPDPRARLVKYCKGKYIRFV